MAEADPQIWGGFVEDRHVGTGQVRGGQDHARSWGVGERLCPYLACLWKSMSGD